MDAESKPTDKYDVDHYWWMVDNSGEYVKFCEELPPRGTLKIFQWFFWGFDPMENPCVVCIDLARPGS